MRKAIDGIIQARMTSSRLPGKVLLPVLGRPLLAYQIERMKSCRSLSRIIVATTTRAEDDAIAGFAEQQMVPVFRGDEHDVLDRYFRAAKAYKCEHIMRLTADCPLIDPETCDHAARRYVEERPDYLCTDESHAEGVDCEIFSFPALETAWTEAQLASEREHVTLYFRNHPDRFRTKTLSNPTDDGRYRITVDQKEDFLVVKAVIEALFPLYGAVFPLDEVKAFLDAHPEIHEVNRNILRNEGLLKSLREDAKTRPGRSDR